jgi:hypothetical protein
VLTECSSSGRLCWETNFVLYGLPLLSHPTS